MINSKPKSLVSERDLVKIARREPAGPLRWSESSMRLLAEGRARRDPDRIGRHAATVTLGVTVRTLQRWHQKGFGPARKNHPCYRPIWYSRTEVEQWASLNGYGS